LYNPSTGEEIGRLPLSGKETAEAAISSSYEAYFTWKNQPIAKRMGFIHAIRSCMERDFEKLAVNIAYDQAKHISEARGEVLRVIELVEMACSIPALIQGDTLDQVSANISSECSTC
jgi:malonate-semialdehyde dehydrogenase (acetylating)/methylmalonate-semialdehyde dehydrogenase